MKYSSYSLNRLEEFLLDALNLEEVTAEDIYSVLIKSLREHEQYHRTECDKAKSLLKMMNGHTEPWSHPDSSVEFTIEDMIKEDPKTYGYEWTPLP